MSMTHAGITYTANNTPGTKRKKRDKTMKQKIHDSEQLSYSNTKNKYHKMTAPTTTALGVDSRREQWFFHNDTGLYSRFSDGSLHSRPPTPSLFACRHMDVVRLFRMSSSNLSRSIALFRPLPARLLTLLPSSMRFFIT